MNAQIENFMNVVKIVKPKMVVTYRKGRKDKYTVFSIGETCEETWSIWLEEKENPAYLLDKLNKMKIPIIDLDSFYEVPDGIHGC